MFPVFHPVVRDVVQAVHDSPPPQPGDDRITMMLTAVAVAIAVATLVIAVATMFLGMFGIFLGYITFVGKAEIIQKAEAAARQAAFDYLESAESVQELDAPAVDDAEIEEQQEIDDEANDGNDDGGLGR